MKGDPDVIATLNDSLTAHLTAINQYFVHSRMCRHWGYPPLAKQKYDESIHQMKHADKVIERVLLLEGIPNMQRLSPVAVGENPKEQHELDLDAAIKAVGRLNQAIALAASKHDNGTRELLEGILKHEEEAVDWHEEQLTLIRDLGLEAYLAEQLHD